MNEYKNILTNIDNQIITITLNRPKALNALSFELLTELNDVFNKINDRTIKVKALIITGAEKAFCAGADITQLAELNTTTGYEFAKFGQSVFSKLEQLPIPSIAAINGYAFGGGCELAMSTSIRIASTKAQFGQPEVKLGVIPGYGGTQRLARLVGKGRALDLCLSGRFIDSTTALAWGLVTNVQEPDALINYTKEYLTTICSMAPLALQGVINSINHGYELSMSEALELEALHFSKTCGTADKVEGVNAFLNKKIPEFTGN
jgi:enoyl-CoA hydratase